MKSLKHFFLTQGAIPWPPSILFDQVDDEFHQQVIHCEKIKQSHNIKIFKEYALTPL